MDLGISQISGGSRTSVGGYAEEEAEEDNSSQFDVSDRRTLDEVVTGFWSWVIFQASVQPVTGKDAQETVSCLL